MTSDELYDVQPRQDNSELPTQYIGEDRVNKVINRDREVVHHKVSQRMLDKYKGKPVRIIKDIEIYTQLCNDLVGDARALQDAKELETFRILKPGTLSKKGMFYSEGIQMVNIYPILKHSSFVHTTNDAFTERYLLPIKFPDGDVFTFMAYDPLNPLEKYKVQKISTERSQNWVRQGNLLGNLESLHQHGKVTEVMVVEGLFDAYQVCNEFGIPSIALLGGKIYKNKQTLLQYIKSKYNCRFIYAPDFDETGLTPYLIKSPLWDDIYNFNKGRKKFEVYKDIDFYLRTTPKEEVKPFGLEQYLKF